MKVFRFAGFLVAALVLVPFAHADGGPVNMVFTGVNGANDGQYYVSPYTGTMNGQTVVLFCDDIKNDISMASNGRPMSPILARPSTPTILARRATAVSQVHRSRTRSLPTKKLHG